MNVKLRKIFIVMLLLFSKAFSFAEESTTAEPYHQGEFPQWVLDLRRTEIITFGSLPLATIGVSLGYGAYLYYTNQIDSFPNPLDKSSTSLTSDQQLDILKISLGVSAGLGLLDLAITLIRRNGILHKKRMQQQNLSHPTVMPLRPEELEQNVLPPEEPSYEIEEVPSDSEYISSAKTLDS